MADIALLYITIFWVFGLDIESRNCFYFIFQDGWDGEAEGPGCQRLGTSGYGSRLDEGPEMADHAWMKDWDGGSGLDEGLRWRNQVLSATLVLRLGGRSSGLFLLCSLASQGSQSSRVAVPKGCSQVGTFWDYLDYSQLSVYPSYWQTAVCVASFVSLIRLSLQSLLGFLGKSKVIRAFVDLNL